MKDLILPKWAQNHSWSLPTLFRRAGMTDQKISSCGNFLIWNKKDTEYVCRNMQDVHHVVSITEWQDKNPGFTLNESVDLELRQLSANRDEILLELEKINNRINKLKKWKKVNETIS